MKKKNYDNHIMKYSKHTKNTRPHSTSLSKNMPINRPQNESKNEIPIIDLLKCPICKKICLININRDQLLFSFECNNNHNKSYQKSNTFQQEDKNISDLNISHENFKTKIKDNLKTNNKIYITEKDFYCTKHPKSKYDSYCFECKENICDECNGQHLNHNKIELNTIKPKENEVILYKNDIKKKDEELNNIIENITKWQKQFEYGLNTIIRIMQNISNLRQFIIMNYDIKQSNQNYNYIQNFNNMKVLNFIFPELQEFLKEPEWKQKGHILIEIIVDIQNKIIKNREKLEIIKIQKEAEKLKENLIKQDKILRSHKKDKNIEEKEDIESIATEHSNKKKSFNTTFSSDCMNNNYFCSYFSKQKKKKVEKRNRNRNNNNNNALTHTIEQNKELEKDLNKENNNKIKNTNISEKNNNNTKIDINLDPNKMTIVESVNTKIYNNKNGKCEELNNKEKTYDADSVPFDIINNNINKNIKDENNNINEIQIIEKNMNYNKIKTNQNDKNIMNENDINYIDYNKKEKSINFNISNNMNNISNNYNNKISNSNNDINNINNNNDDINNISNNDINNINNNNDKINNININNNNINNINNNNDDINNSNNGNKNNNSINDNINNSNNNNSINDYREKFK